MSDFLKLRKEFFSSGSATQSLMKHNLEYFPCSATTLECPMGMMRKEGKAAMGFEPMNHGFAIRSLGPLGHAAKANQACHCITAKGGGKRYHNGANCLAPPRAAGSGLARFLIERTLLLLIFAL